MSSTRRPGPTQLRVHTVRLPWTTDSVPQIRREIVADLSDGTVPEGVIDEAESVVAELVGNALLHGTPLPDGTVRVHWKVRAPRVEIEVTDGGSDTTPHPKRQTAWAPSGRGLRIVRSLAHEWGVSDDEHRTTVWVALGGPSRRRV